MHEKHMETVKGIIYTSITKWHIHTSWNTAGYYAAALPYWTQSRRGISPVLGITNPANHSSTHHLNIQDRHGITPSVLTTQLIMIALQHSFSSYRGWSVHRLSLNQPSECSCRLENNSTVCVCLGFALREQGPIQVSMMSTHLNSTSGSHSRSRPTRWIHTKAHQYLAWSKTVQTKQLIHFYW